ncbi:MAG: CBS domain-containing protein [Planctomycetota bacterium]|jgi:CBS domain-containing protein
MQVKEIMTCNVETISSDANLVEAAQKMRALEVGALPIWENDELIGMITDRDITIRGVADKKNPSSTSVKEIMTSEVCCCFEDDDIHEAAKMMEEKSIHRLLVVNSNNEPVGFVSLSDFAVKSHDEHLTYEVLERISGPACPHR